MKIFNLGNRTIDIFIVALGILSGIGVFAVIQNISHKKEVQNYIPNAKTAFSNKEYSNAINIYQKAEREFPDDIDIKRNLGELFLLKGKYDDSINYYNQIPASKLKDVDLEKLGEAYFEKNNSDKAIETWTKAKLLKPENTYKLAKLYYSKGQLENYISELNKIKNTKEGLILTQIENIDLNSILSNSGTAQSLKSVSNENLDIESFRVQIENAKSQFDLGKTDFSELIQISAFTDLKQCRFLFERISNLRKTLDSKKIPTGQVDYYEGVCLNEIGDADKAMPLLQSAINSDTTVVEYREALAKSYFIKKDFTNLKKTYDEIFVIKKDSIYYNNYGYYSYKLSKFDDAINAYNEALKLSTNNDSKSNIALTISQINLLDKKDLGFCNNSEILNLLTTESKEQKIILNHCKIYKNQYQPTTSSAELADAYFNALKAKDKNKVMSALDKDLDGILTAYYKAVGTKLIN